ncbi:MAG: site-specific integrase [Pseudomonadota bacterium]|nr:site-specific integrase [Pseudomonadota bacterium]MEE3155417.1 site-specific integrase [Pseudomonadota bacterium]
MSLYQRPGSPFWQYSFTVNGVRFRGSTGCTGKREARIVEVQERTKASERKTYADAWRLRDCLGAYWQEHGKHQQSRDFIEHKLAVISKHLGPNTMIADLTNADMIEYQAKRRGEGLQAHSVNRDFNCLRAALNHARVLHGQKVPEIAWNRIRAKEPPNRTRFLSQEEYHELLSVCDEALAKIVRFAVATGLRKANILKLDWREVDLTSGLITVIVKGDKTHTVRMTGQVRAMLSTDTTRKGRVFDTKNFRKKWDKAVTDAELEDFTFHDLRHTFASWARMAGADLADICEALGHSSVTVTMRYAHIEPAHHKTAFDRVSADVWSQSASQSRRKAAE